MAFSQASVPAFLPVWVLESVYGEAWAPEWACDGELVLELVSDVESAKGLNAWPAWVSGAAWESAYPPVAPAFLRAL